jgi:predicted anti-sigma-YlaC factor YlaD
MRCSKAKRYLEKYLDGELDPHLQAKLNAHLDVCAQCKAGLWMLKKCS